RMILAVPKNKIKALKEIFKKEDVEATVIGEFTNTKRLVLRYQERVVCDLDMDFLHDGLPRIVRKAHWQKTRHKEPRFPQPKDLTPYLLKVLSSWNICSKEWIIRQYDHEVQGGSVIKPLVGVNNDGPSDAAVARPILDSKKGIAVSNGINPRYGELDPYWMAASCVDEALRQIIAVGGNLKEVALLDNFCWGDTDQPKQLGNLVRAAHGCYDIAKNYGTPFISGKDSLHNEYIVGKKRVSIPGTLLISAIGVLDDVTKTVTMDFKEPGNFIYVIGDTYDELGGSHYYALYGAAGNYIPRVNAKHGRKLMDKLSYAIQGGLVKACHDCSEGGIGVAIAEMAFAGDYGAQIYLNKVPFRLRYLRGGSRRDDYVLFSESNTRFIVEVKEENANRFEKLMKGIAVGLIGRVQYRKDLTIYGLGRKTVARTTLSELKESWQKPLRW
ncbi:MAG: phosphoribosylformylglycinamidine synthase, partial [Omnitrophica WOR_2 bacterium SM23_29]